MTRELRRDVLLPLIVLMAIVVLTSAGTVALLARTAPTIERIMSENVYSLEATEEMLAVIAHGPATDGERLQFEAALKRAEGNITEDSERASLSEVRTQMNAALSGEIAARDDVIQSLRDVGNVNRGAVIRGDDEATRLGYASAWAAVFLGAISFAWGLAAVRRARARLINPLHEVAAVLEAARAGDRYRRCKRIPAPAELERIMAGVDDLLDARALRRWADEPGAKQLADRSVLVFLLEQKQGPAFVLGTDGSVEASNQAGLKTLQGEESDVQKRLKEAVAAEAPPDDIRLAHIEGADRWIAELV